MIFIIIFNDDHDVHDDLHDVQNVHNDHNDEMGQKGEDHDKVRKMGLRNSIEYKKVDNKVVIEHK